MTLKHVKPDPPPDCPGCGRALVLGTRTGNEMSASCLHCGQRVILGLRENRWIVRDRSTLSAAIPG
jgi:DNA-directed RNA polymerase subunit RPC12/RpoP